MERPEGSLDLPGYDSLIEILGSTYGVSNNWSERQTKAWSDYSSAYRHALLESSEAGERIPAVYEEAVSCGVPEHWLKLAEIFAIRDHTGGVIIQHRQQGHAKTLA